MSSGRHPPWTRARLRPNPRPKPSPSPPKLTKDTLIEATDQCVKCGLCLPHCPTYRLTRDEAESPRGRIALIQALTSGALPPSERLDAHLANCLECRACEPVCPSLVAVGTIMDQARARRIQALPTWRRWIKRVWLSALASPGFMRLAERLAALGRATGLARVALGLGPVRLPRLYAYARLGAGLSPPPRWDQADQADRGIALFLGCVAEVAQPASLSAAALVLGRLGISVTRPASQGCCGAMFRHNGFPDEADTLLDRNATALSGRLLIGLASACVAELRTHPGLAQTQEICAFLATLPWPAGLTLNPLPVDVLVHEPCSHRNQLGGNADVHRLLARIPGLRVAPLPDNALCCGAAGTYLLQHPQTAGDLLADKLSHLVRLQPQILVTTNPGCALHLAAGLREVGLSIEVCHPVELIARQLPRL
jgi:glycolate oxidase iron-sulfur subunit